MSISEAPEATANCISSSRADNGVCPAGKPVATTVQQLQNSRLNSKYVLYQCSCAPQVKFIH